MPDNWDEQIPGSDDLDPALLRSKKGLLATLSGIPSSAIGAPTPGDSNYGYAPVPMSGETETESGGSSGSGTTVAGSESNRGNRIMDDMNGGKSGSPMGDQPKATTVPGTAKGYTPPTGYESRLKDLMSQEQALSSPPAKPSMKHRLLTALADAGPTLLAAKFGGMGGTTGADQAMKAGIARREHEQDLDTQTRNQERARLSEEIEREISGEETGERQWNMEMEKERMQEEGMTLREKMAQEAETGRQNRLAETIAGQNQRETEKEVAAGKLQQQKADEAEALERERQQGRMQVQMVRNQGNQVVAKIRAAAAQTRVPPVLAKSMDTYQTSVSRLDVMEDNYNKALADPSNQGAMQSLLYNHLGMTMGLQPGSKMNRATIEEAYKSGVLTERIDAHFDNDGYLSGVVLTPRQMSQFVDLARTRVGEDERKMSAETDYFESVGAFNPKVPGGGGPSPSRPGGGGPSNRQQGAGGGSPQSPPRPANVPPDYEYKANGPKGKGWYKPDKKPGTGTTVTVTTNH